MSVVPKFIDDPTIVVDSAIDGLCMAHRRIQRLENTNVVVAKDADPSKVLLLCGGGSGHEPAHCGFVAKGWLSAAVCGSVYASPPTAHVAAGIEHLARLQGPNGPGILVVIKNYAGDNINFNYAVMQARQRGIKVETTLAADDMIFGTEDTSKRRGVAGCCLLYKILGAAAMKGASLSELKSLADRVSRNMRSIGASLSSCSLPGCPPSSVLPKDVVEIGLGIHGEKGMVQVPYTGAQQLCQQMVDVLLNAPGAAKLGAPGRRVAPLPAGAKAVLLVNNLGGTTDMEMSVVTAHALRMLTKAGVKVAAVNAGRHMTALDMHGFSLTLLTVEQDADMAYILDTDTVQEPLMGFDVPTLKPSEAPGAQTALALAKAECTAEVKAAVATSPLHAAIKNLMERLEKTEARFNALDAAVGDGDLGSGVHRASLASLEVLPYLPYEKNVGRTFELLSKAVADACAGTSGPLYGALLIGGGAGAQECLSAGGNAVDAVRAAIAQGTRHVQALGGAKKGDRTMVDVLEALRESKEVNAAKTMPELMRACLKEGRAAAIVTSNLPAKFGRSRYMGGKEVGMKDPGAELVVFWLEVLAAHSTPSQL